MIGVSDFYACDEGVATFGDVRSEDQSVVEGPHQYGHEHVLKIWPTRRQEQQSVVQWLRAAGRVPGRS